MNLRDEKILASVMEKAVERLDETLLETCADQEYRLCLLELGIN